MLNVKGKEPPGKYGKAITENALLEQGKHKAGLGEVSPPTHIQNTDGGITW